MAPLKVIGAGCGKSLLLKHLLSLDFLMPNIIDTFLIKTQVALVLRVSDSLSISLGNNSIRNAITTRRCAYQNYCLL